MLHVNKFQCRGPTYELDDVLQRGLAYAFILSLQRQVEHLEEALDIKVEVLGALHLICTRAKPKRVIHSVRQSAT